jgi:hypothetical protein
LGVLRTKRAALQAKLNDLAADVRVGSQLRRGSADLHEQLAGIDKVLADAVSTSPAARIARR